MLRNIDLWPSWYYGPNGEAEIFQREDQVPAGWLDHPIKHLEISKQSAKKSKSKESLDL